MVESYQCAVEASNGFLLSTAAPHCPTALSTPYPTHRQVGFGGICDDVITVKDLVSEAEDVAGYRWALIKSLFA